MGSKKEIAMNEVTLESLAKRVEALEIALKAFEDCLPTNTHRDENEALSLDQAMAFVRSRSPRD